MNSNELENKIAWVRHNKKNRPDAIKKLGRIHSLVFHPKKSRIVGFLVKRPDIAWMFRREDAFVAINGFDILEDDSGKQVIVVKDDPWATGRGALKAQNVNLDDCLIWIGLSLLCEDGTSLGTIGSVDFEPESGQIKDIIVSQGATANALLGKRKIPAAMVKGFRLGVGSKINMPDNSEDGQATGAIIVKNEAKDIPVSGGAAETAGEATAIVADKVKKTSAKAKEKMAPAMNNAGKAVQKGAYVTGRQIARTEGMFKNFKDEFKKAMNDDASSDK